MSKHKGKRDTRRENWVRFGLIEPTYPIHLKGRQRIRWEPDPSTAAREAVIIPYLAQRHTLAETADELILLGHDLPAKHVRRWLEHALDAHIKDAQERLRERTVSVGEETSDEVSARLTRKMRTVQTSLPKFSLDDLLDDLPTTGRIGSISPEADNWDAFTETAHALFLGANGLLPPTLHGIEMPSDAPLNFRRLRALLDHTTDARLSQALTEAREQLQAVDWSSMLRALAGFPEKLFVHEALSLMGHRCTTQHSLPQTLLMRGVLAILDPIAFNSPEDWAPPGFLAGLNDGLLEAKRLLGHLGS